MSNTDNPAESTGGDNVTPSTAEALPAKLRVHALAKRLATSSRAVLTAITELGGSARTVQSSVDRELAQRVADHLGNPVGEQQEQPATEPVAAAAPAESEATATTEPEPAEQPAQPAQAEKAEKAEKTETSERVVAEEIEQARTVPELFLGPKQNAQAETESGGALTLAPANQLVKHQPPAAPVFAAASPLFLPPEPKPAEVAPEPKEPDAADPEPAADTSVTEDEEDADSEDANRKRRRRGRRGRGRGKGAEAAEGGDGTNDEAETDKQDGEKPGQGKQNQPKQNQQKQNQNKQDAPADQETEDTDATEDGDEDGGSRRRRRRRRRKGTEDGNGGAAGDPPNTVTHVRDGNNGSGDEVRAVRGSTRLEAKRQRRRDGREAGRRRTPILSEAEFLARRESVQRRMVVREQGEHTQIGVLEDGVLVEHFVTAHGSGSLVGNVYLGRVQNVLPSMEAAFVDIGRGRNAVLYAGEVDWDAAGLEGKSRRIEQALSTGDAVLVQVTKDPVGHKGARLTTQISLPGRFLVYVPGGSATGISRKLPDNERRRLKDILKRIVPEDAGVIIRTASEGISEEDLERDVRRLQVQWEAINDRSKSKSAKAPELVYEEPDLLVKVVRDLFTEDFAELVVAGDTAWETINSYIEHVAPEMTSRVRKHVAQSDVFTEYRVDEQIAKALDRKVWLPSGGYLVIDRTEAMTVIDVNTGKFTGSGGNLEETVTRNNLESAEEIVRQLRLRDIGGIIVIDFIDMVLESNRDLVLRRLTECLGRDRTRHQVAEVTSLGLVQMTRKRVGTGLLEAFSTPCEHCKGRGVVVSATPVDAPAPSAPPASNGNGRKSRKNKDRGEQQPQQQQPQQQQQQQDPEEAQRAAQRIAATALLHAKAAEAAQKDTGSKDSEESESTGAAAAEAAPAAQADSGAQVDSGDKGAESASRPAVNGANGHERPEPVAASTPVEDPGAESRASAEPHSPAQRPAGPPQPASVPENNGHVPTETGSASVVAGTQTPRRTRRVVSRPSGAPEA
ncbi:translation initiation factor IF-2 N-terminal domain-containing protein [Sciscionella sediminilitoris]|uniref:translation initiation factor IF-2 N-terminal domain-containing protein n=1 Tax=Sciscionella sediminilitoris TaxID=1445613 RepID=UPI0004DF7540|nr:translation initiation factor IF-2 N-terminal domain-containing protein [Sciscionella sp. SE31]